jgi:hypothetical protein
VVNEDAVNVDGVLDQSFLRFVTCNKMMTYNMMTKWNLKTTMPQLGASNKRGL